MPAAPLNSGIVKRKNLSLFPFEFFFFPFSHLRIQSVLLLIGDFDVPLPFFLKRLNPFFRGVGLLFCGSPLRTIGSGPAVFFFVVGWNT